MGLGNSTIYQLISKGPYSQRHIKPQNSLFFGGLQSGKVPSRSSFSETYSLRTKQEDVFYKINHIFVNRTVNSTACKFTLFVLQVSKNNLSVLCKKKKKNRIPLIAKCICLISPLYALIINSWWNPKLCQTHHIISTEIQDNPSNNRLPGWYCLFNIYMAMGITSTHPGKRQERFGYVTTAKCKEIKNTMYLTNNNWPLLQWGYFR